MNFFKPQKTAGEIADLMILLLDCLAFFALATTGEIHAWVFVFATSVATVRFFGKFKLSDNVIVALLLLVIFGAVAIGLKGKIHPVWLAAHGIPLVHSILWLANNVERFRSWRVGMGFIGLVVAASLTPEFHIFALIILFILICSLAVSSIFLDNTLRLRAPSLARRPLPKGFVRYSVALSTIIFLSSLIIFPILPRAQLGTGLGFGRSDIGYKEEVNSAEWAHFREGGDDHIVLRIFVPEQWRNQKTLPFSYLRGKVLENFDGKEWSAALKISSELAFNNHETDTANNFEVISEPIASTVLIVPYGAAHVAPISIFSSLHHLNTGEWTIGSLPNKRLHYNFNWKSVHGDLFGARDLPRPVHSRLVEYPSRAQMYELSQRIAKGLTSDADKIQALQTYLKREKFSATLAQTPVADQDPLNYFLFKSKAGHCELFASATALLLRHMGIPTRVVVGFRPSRFISGSVLTVSNTDAHAWVEAYTKERGWVMLDTTPMVFRPGKWNVVEWFRDSYDSMSSYWYRYILSFDAETQFDIRQNFARELVQESKLPKMRIFLNAGWLRNATVLLFILLSVTISSWLLWRGASIYWFGLNSKTLLDQNRERLLRKERERFLRVTKRYQIPENALSDWHACYERHRYGERFDLGVAKTELALERKRLVRA